MAARLTDGIRTQGKTVSHRKEFFVKLRNVIDYVRKSSLHCTTVSRDCMPVCGRRVPCARKGESVVSTDENNSIQARLPTHPSLPAFGGKPMRVEQKYARGGG